MFEDFCQIWIVLCGGASIWLLSRLEHWKRWGYILGLLSEPAWLYISITNKQYGITVLVIWYTYSFAQGTYNYWIKKHA